VDNQIVRYKKTTAVFAPLVFLFISACTPPMPPDVLAAIAEQEVTCIPGDVKVGVDAETTPLIQSAIDLYITSCELSTITLVQDGLDADIVIFDNSAARLPICSNSVAAVPFVVEGAGIALNYSGATSLNFDAEVLTKIYSGQITDWADPAIAALNPESELISLPIVLMGLPTANNSILSFEQWMKNLGASNFQVKVTQPAETLEQLAEAFTTTDGSLGIFPAEFISENALTVGPVVVPEGSAVFDIETMSSAGTQVKSEINGDVLTASLDPSIAVASAEGTDQVNIPWQAISWLNLAICKADDVNIGARAFARFLLRQDAQGQFTTLGYVPLEESLRLNAAGIIGKTLPTPTGLATPTE
jgi:ABC-type phosphate transport system substrate-binding protein